MTITNISSFENGGEREEITVHNEENYISSNKARLNDKWHYDIDTETFLRDLPKVGRNVMFYCLFFSWKKLVECTVQAHEIYKIGQCSSFFIWERINFLEVN